MDKDIQEFLAMVKADQQKAIAPAINFSDILDAVGLGGPHLEAKELDDRTFLIVRAKACESEFDASKHFYYCICRDEEHNEDFTTALGGVAVVDMLDAYMSLNIDNPLRVTLRFVKQGKHDGYYVLE